MNNKKDQTVNLFKYLGFTSASKKAVTSSQSTGPNDAAQPQHVVRSVVISFIIGGSIIALVKYVATRVKDPALASAIAGLPIGLIAIFFLTKDEAGKYAENYIFVTISLLSAITTFYVLYSNKKTSQTGALFIAIGVWIFLVFGRYALMKFIKE